MSGRGTSRQAKSPELDRQRVETIASIRYNRRNGKPRKKYMLTRNAVFDILKRELPLLKQRYFVKKIALFGSYAKGTQKDSSDIDIVVEFEKPVGFLFIELAEYLENILGKKVDILTSDGVKTIRIKETAKDIEGSLVYV